MRDFPKIAAVVAFAVTGSAVLAVTSGRADANAPVCAQTYGKSDGLSCNYATYDQCRAFLSGLAGSCVGNPFLRDAVNVPRARGKRRSSRR